MFGRILFNTVLSRSVGARTGERSRVLNVGGGSKAIPIPRHYDQWNQVLLDVDARGHPDIVCDARSLQSLEASQFDAVYCSHNLEHYYRHDVPHVLRGFRHVLKPQGFVEIRVPDIECVIRRVVETGMQLDDILYQSAAGPITPLDVIYGYGVEIATSGNDFYAHKNGFSAKLLSDTLNRAGFANVRVLNTPQIFELRGLAFQSQPTADQLRLLGLSSA